MILSVIIPSCEGLNLLKQSTPALVKSTKQAKINDYEIIIINNGPEDGSKRYLQKFKQINYLAYPKPLGFAKAINIGIRKAKGNYILLLNNDCIVNTDTVGKLINFLKINKTIYFTQPIIKESGIKTIGYKVDLKVAKAFPVGIKTDDKKFINQTNIWQNNWLYGLSATCLMLKKETFNKVGYSDESFGSYLEDIDFMFRAVKKGINFAPCRQTIVNHLHMQTSKKMGSYKAKHDFLNWIRIIFKHYPFSYILKNLFPLLIERARNFKGVVFA